MYLFAEATAFAKTPLQTIENKNDKKVEFKSRKICKIEESCKATNYEMRSSTN